MTNLKTRDGLKDVISFIETKGLLRTADNAVRSALHA
jgi:hypothetical protein